IARRLGRRRLTARLFLWGAVAVARAGRAITRRPVIAVSKAADMPASAIFGDNGSLAGLYPLAPSIIKEIGQRMREILFGPLLVNEVGTHFENVMFFLLPIRVQAALIVRQRCLRGGQQARDYLLSTLYDATAIDGCQ